MRLLHVAGRFLAASASFAADCVAKTERIGDELGLVKSEFLGSVLLTLHVR
jgi:hypothetical protein